MESLISDRQVDCQRNVSCRRVPGSFYVRINWLKNFRHKGLKELFETGNSKGVPGAMRSRIVRQLDVLDAATSVRGVNVPGYQLHPLKGDRKGEFGGLHTSGHKDYGGS